jgi:uncharacterized membrane protein
MSDKFAEALLYIGITAGALVGGSVGFEYAGFGAAILGAIIGSTLGPSAIVILVFIWKGLR